MLSLLSLSLVLAVLPGHGSRMNRQGRNQQGKEADDASVSVIEGLTSTRPGWESVDTGQVTSKLDAKVGPNDVLAGLYDAMAEANYSSKTWERDVALSVLGTTLGLAHPVVGVAFSIMVQALKPKDNMMKRIEDMVNLQIKKSLQEYNSQLIRNKLVGLQEAIRDPVPSWGAITREMSGMRADIFYYHCWISDRAPCKAWHTLGGGGPEAYLYAIMFLDYNMASRALMISEGAPEYKNTDRTIKRGGELTSQHITDWDNYRFGKNGQKPSITKWSRYKGWDTPYEAVYNQGEDLWLGTRLTGHPQCFEHKKRVPWSKRAKYDGWQDNCYNAYLNKVRKQVEDMKKSVQPVLKAIKLWNLQA